MIPQIYKEVCAQLTGLLDPEMNWSVSFTTNTWTAENTVQSFMGLTAYWITDAFVNMSCVIDCSLFTVYWATYSWQPACSFQQMLSKWNTDSSRCHAVLRDNAANISKCFRIASIPSFGLFRLSHILSSSVCFTVCLASMQYPTLSLYPGSWLAISNTRLLLPVGWWNCGWNLNCQTTNWYRTSAHTGTPHLTCYDVHWVYTVLKWMVHRVQLLTNGQLLRMWFRLALF